MSDLSAELPHEGPVQVGAWPGFALAADAAVRHLHERHGLDLWMVTHADGDRQVVVASAGPWARAVRPDAVLSWPQSFCARVVDAAGPVLEPDVLASPWRPLAVGTSARVRAYAGVPLLGDGDELFGSLCAYSGRARPDLTGVADSLHLLGRLLSTVLRGEQVAAERSHDAAMAYALAERDRLTGLRNRRGWEASLEVEESRVRRYGAAVSLLVVDLDDLKRLNDRSGHAAGDDALVRCARVLEAACRPGDAVARLGGDEFGVLAVECDAVCARALALRLRVALRSAGVAASVGRATRRTDEGLAQTWRRADEAMYVVKRRHQRTAP